jgi:hypothetical protein
MVDVPCYGCTACCKNERIILAPENGDDLDAYEKVLTRQGDGEPRWMLKHKPGGDCVYLGAEGCTIHDRAPYVCRQFDCRRWLLDFPIVAKRGLPPDDLDGNVFRAAWRLLKEEQK